MSDKGEGAERTPTVSKAPVYSTGTYESLDIDLSTERSEYVEADSTDPLHPEESPSTDNETETTDNEKNGVSTDTVR